MTTDAAGLRAALRDDLARAIVDGYRTKALVILADDVLQVLDDAYDLGPWLEHLASTRATAAELDARVAAADKEPTAMIENTSKRDHLLNLVGLMDDPDAYITGMEADGQRQLVNSDRLPKEGPWDELQALGFGPPEPTDDDLFVRTTLPEGWSKRGTDHAMHSTIVDERGVERVGVFYKAAFYDRRANCHLLNPGDRLATEGIYGDGEPTRPELWDVLTDEERESFVNSLRVYVQQAEEHPSIYADQLSRVRALADAVGVSL